LEQQHMLIWLNTSYSQPKYNNCCVCVAKRCDISLMRDQQFTAKHETVGTNGI